MEQTDWAAKWAIYSPDKIACKEYETGRTMTYGELNTLGKQISHTLCYKYQLKKGDRIAIIAENCLEYLLLFVVAQKTGCILVPLNFRLAKPEIEYLIKDAAPTLLIYQEGLNAFTEKPEDLPKDLICMTLSSFKKLYTENKNETRSINFTTINLQEDDPVFILYTSGTTGFPKGAIYTHKMLFWNSTNTAMSLMVNTNSRTINCMPFFHTGGWNVLTTPFFHHGGFTCLLKKFDPDVVLNLLREEAATIFMGVPTMLKMMADVPAFESADFSKLLYFIVGGEPMPIPLIEKYHKKNVAIRQGFGMTEVGPNLTSLHQDDAVRKKGSIGRPNFYLKIKIVDEDGTDVSTGQPGELLLQGAVVTPGYWQNPEATQKAIRQNWFYTGDIVRQDEAGYLYVVDRIKNMFISGGENVYPAEVERVLCMHEAVAAAAVIGVPDERWGESGKAFVVLKPGLQKSANELLKFCKSKLAKFKVPRTIVFMEALPQNATGKIDKKILARMN